MILPLGGWIVDTTLASFEMESGGSAASRAAQPAEGSPLTGDQSALQDLARNAERGPARGQPPLTAVEANAMIEWANKYGIGVDAGADHIQGGHWVPIEGQPPVPHIHLFGEYFGNYHLPVPADFVPNPN